jgi:hypothetical protein
VLPATKHGLGRSVGCTELGHADAMDHNAEVDTRPLIIL